MAKIEEKREEKRDANVQGRDEPRVEVVQEQPKQEEQAQPEKQEPSAEQQRTDEVAKVQEEQEKLRQEAASADGGTPLPGAQEKALRDASASESDE